MTPLFEQLISVINMVDPNTGEKVQPEKQYLVLVTWSNQDENDEPTMWKVIHSREEVLRFLVMYHEDIDFDQTYVCSESIQCNKTWHAYTFARFCAEESIWNERLDNEFSYSFEDFEAMLLEDYEITQDELDATYLEEVNM